MIAGTYTPFTTRRSTGLFSMTNTWAGASRKSGSHKTPRWRKQDSNLYGAFPVKRLFLVLLPVLCSERESRSSFSNRATGVKKVAHSGLRRIVSARSWHAIGEMLFLCSAEGRFFVPACRSTCKRTPLRYWVRLVPVANRRAPRASRSALTSDGAARVGGACLLPGQ